MGKHLDPAENDACGRTLEFTGKSPSIGTRHLSTAGLVLDPNSHPLF